MSKIYYLTDATGDIRYVGKTDKHLKIRLAEHLKDKKITHKTNWINKAGKASIQINLIEECESSIWVQREMYWIKYFRDKGFNLTNTTDGGEGMTGLIHTEKAKDKISKAALGRILSNETKVKISKAIKGRKHTEEAKQSMSVAKSEETKQKMSAAKSIPILQLDKQGVFIKEWNSTTEAATALNISLKAISNVLTGRTKTSGGYMWVKRII